MKSVPMSCYRCGSNRFVVEVLPSGADRYVCKECESIHCIDTEREIVKIMGYNKKPKTAVEHEKIREESVKGPDETLFNFIRERDPIICSTCSWCEMQGYTKEQTYIKVIEALYNVKQRMLDEKLKNELYRTPVLPEGTELKPRVFDNSGSAPPPFEPPSVKSMVLGGER